MPSVAANDLDVLYRSHGAWLKGWLARRAKCQARASDLAQETFCRLAEQPQLQLRAHPRRYLATVARRLLIDESRRRSSEKAFLGALALHTGDRTALAPDRVSEAVDQLCRLLDLLADLPVKARRAFLLSRLDGWSYAEIAADLGVSSSMVKQYIARAHAHCYIVLHGDAG